MTASRLRVFVAAPPLLFSHVLRLKACVVLACNVFLSSIATLFVLLRFSLYIYPRYVAHATPLSLSHSPSVMSFLGSFGKKPGPQVTRTTTVRPDAPSPKPRPPPTKADAAPPKRNVARPQKPRADPPRTAKPVTKVAPPPKKPRVIAATIREDRKRKSATPTTPQFDSDSGEEEQDLNEILHTAKKPRLGGSPDVDTSRRVRDVSAWMNGTSHEEKIIHGNDLTGARGGRDYTPAFTDHKDAVVDLHYPGGAHPERFALVIPKKVDGYAPLHDISESIEQTLENFFPESERKQHLDDMTGISRNLRKAVNRQDLDAYKDTIAQFNKLVQDAQADGSMERELDGMHSLSFSLVERILDQVTVRTVSPQSEKLRHYESFSSNTYGELREEFNSQIFRDTHMNSKSVFVDLGSGVGNVVLQAALEVGCESYGIEMMPNPCELAQAQGREFAARCRMWGLSTGKVSLLDGDFLEDTRVTGILAKADVVLVNNELFSADLNEKLRARFLDLKEGARVVSLKSFVPPGWRLTERTSEDPCGVLAVEKKPYWSGCVSWTSKGGNYYISTKDSGRIARVLSGQLA